MGLGYEKSLCYCDDHLHNLFAMVLKATTCSSLIIHFVILDKSHNYNHVNDLGELESFFPCFFLFLVVDENVYIPQFGLKPLFSISRQFHIDKVKLFDLFRETLI